MILDSYYTTDSAARYLGVTPTTVRNLTADGKISPTKVGNSNLYHIADLSECRRRWYADGLTAREIGEKYGISKPMVHYHLKKLNVKHTGVDGRRKGQPFIFSTETVDKMAKIIGWEVLENWVSPPAMIRCPACGAESPKGDKQYLETLDCGKCGASFRIPT